MRNGVSRLRVTTARAAEVVLGFIFLAGAIAKALDVGLFARQISFYGVLPDQPTVLAITAVATITIETALGAAMMLGCRLRGLVTLAVPPLLAFFTCLIVYGWVFYDLEDCGCFGPIEMSPAISIAKNGALFALWFVAWAGHSALATEARAVRVRCADCVKGALCLICTAAVGLYATAHAGTDPAALQGVFSGFVFDADEQTWDLGADKYLVAVFNATCEHCMGEVDALNTLAATAGFPRVVGLCFGEPDQIEAFRSATRPTFPIHPIGEETFWELISVAPPKFYYIIDGAVIKTWNEKTPAPDEVLF